MAKRIAYLGPQGTNSEDAARKYNSDMDLVPYSSFIEVFNATNKGEVDFGIIPLENSIEGTVNLTLDLLAGSHELKIVGEVVIDVAHGLATKPGVQLKDITAVVSHPQALAQCRYYLEENLPGVTTMKVSSTGEAARIVAHNAETWAAIVNEKAAQLNGLTLLASNIQDSSENKTRFIVLGKENMPLAKVSKTSIIVSITDRPGGLYQILKVFALENINLTKIESRPAKKSLGSYIFFIEMAGHYQDPKISECLRLLKNQVASLKLLGSYPAATPASKSEDNWQNSWTLPQVREDIDIIDYQIIELLAERTRLVNMVGELKKEGQIKDSSREQKVLEKVKNTAREKGFDPVVTEKMYRLLFDHFVNLQQLQN